LLSLEATQASPRIGVPAQLMKEANMNNATATAHRKEMFVRSCLESAPSGAGIGSGTGRGPGFSQGPARLHVLKQNLLHAALQQTNLPRLHKQLCGAANTAAELAWNTACPLLAFPCLFEEMARALFNRFAHEPPWTMELEPVAAVEAEGVWKPNLMPLAA
jgi:hypothetical protein